jgi:CheY-like chemotaxis protein
MQAAALTQRLLAFSRQKPLQNQLIDVNEMLHGMLEMLRGSLGEAVRLEILTHPDVWNVEVDPNQLESSILNLAVNARDAMHDGGKLTLEASNVHLDHAYSNHHAEVAPGHYVVLSVIDTGHGMDEETLARAFEPFFTTKEVGRGTGLGLSMVYDFIKQSGGHVQITSGTGAGTAVKVFLPRSSQTLPDRRPDAAPIRAKRESTGETILVAEDSDDVRAYMVECLRGMGYRVLEAHDGESALRLLGRLDISVDLLFSDMAMPGMTGRELADKACHIHPQLRILFTSGYPRGHASAPEHSLDGIAVLAKPFTTSGLAEAIRATLDQGSVGAL